MQPIAQVGRAGNESPQGEDARRTHEALLQEALTEGRVLSIAPHTTNANEDLLVLGPVNVLGDEAKSGHGATVAIIELWMRGDASPATRRGCEQFLTAVCELAADYHAFHELRSLRQDEHHRSELLELGPIVHNQLGLSATAYAVANEGRRVVGCDRLNVLVAHGQSCRLLAASGVSRVERRSGAARQLTKVAELVRKTDEPAYYSDGECDALPPVAEAIARHVEESHARHIAAIPLRRPVEPNSDDAVLTKKQRRLSRQERPQFVLVAEQFDSREGELRRDWLVEVAEVATTALYNALTVDRMPLGWLLRPLGKVKEAAAEHLSRAALIATAIMAAIRGADFDAGGFQYRGPRNDAADDAP